MQSRSVAPIENLPAYLEERVRRLNRIPVNESGEYILYWMHHAVRAHDNPALETAVWLGNHLHLPVVVYQSLGGHHPYNSDRHYTFIMEGARYAQKKLAQRGIRHLFFLPLSPVSISPLIEMIDRSAICLTEDFPVYPFVGWTRRLAKMSKRALWAVDTACILPMQLVKKSYGRAYQFRKDTWHRFEKRLFTRFESLALEAAPYNGTVNFDAIDLAQAEIADLCARSPIDHTVGPVSHTRGGSLAGYQRWEKFKRVGLDNYHKTRNDAAVDFPEGVSRLSAYLHHGHVSPFRIVRDAASSGGPGAAKFLDELLIWRELAHNFCFFNDAPNSIHTLPDWALKSLTEHSTDPRSAVYSWEKLARGRTGDKLWDAAQASLLIHGELHNNLRMTWGKALLQWTRSPQEALNTMIDLNHRFALDGSDPNSYGGILWCLGLFDRPFLPEKPVIGKLRPRSTAAHARRLDMPRYANRIYRPAGGTRLRVAVIGAGLSGLVVAQALQDNGHEVKVFEKARGAGGRMSTRRASQYAFDHGAQYFTVRDPRFKQRVDSWIASGIVRPWDGRIGVIRDGQIHKEKGSHSRFVGVPGMSAVGRHLAQDLNILWSTRIVKIQKEDNGDTALFADHGGRLGAYDVVIATAPAEQSAQLIAGQTPMAKQLSSIEMTPCWAVMLAFADPLNLPFDGAFFHGSELSWVARNSSKPNRPKEESWVLHADPDWSSDHFGLSPAKVIQHLTTALFNAVPRDPIEPCFAAAHRWTYARARQALSIGAMWDPLAKIGVCGDWCNGSRIEGAFLSGAAMAGRVLAFASNADMRSV